MLICTLCRRSRCEICSICASDMCSLLLFVRLVKFVVVAVDVAVGVCAPILYYNNSQDNSSVAQAVDVKIAIKMFTPKGGGVTCSVHRMKHKFVMQIVKIEQSK